MWRAVAHSGLDTACQFNTFPQRQSTDNLVQAMPLT